MKVYILCKRFIDLEKNAIVSKIMAVYENADEAYERLDQKHCVNDFNWYIVAKPLRKNKQDADT